MKYIVYIIKHIETASILYVGVTNNFQRRKKEHLSLNTKTKKWLTEIGIDNVLIEPVAEFETEEDALKYEDSLIIKYDTINRGYNKNRSGLIKAENPDEYIKKYRQTEEHKEHKRKYNIEYRKTEKYKEYQRKYRQTEKYKEYYQSEKYKESCIKYRKTEKYKEHKIDYMRVYQQTDKCKKYKQEYMRDYRKAKKLGMTVKEYRELYKI